MIHTIEALIDQRKGLQNRIKSELTRLSDLVSLPFWKQRKKRDLLSSSLQQLGDSLMELITVQDREWDAQHNNHSSGVFASLQVKMEKLEAEYRLAKTVLDNFSELENRLSHLIERLPIDQEKSTFKTELTEIRERLSPFQYADFEQRFRGGREAVQTQLRRYLPLFANRSPVLDLGCGRGEFVSMLLESGVEVSGIDLSLTMLKEAQTRNLPCQKGEIQSHLSALPPQSLGGIFSAQVIEHLEADPLRQLVNQAFRVLKPQGLLLLETINPLSLFAFSRIYLLDTTHRSALHPEFMRYLVESAGFTEVEILYGPTPDGERLDLLPVEAPHSAIHNENIDKLNRLLFGPTIYAVKGIKS